MEQTILNVAVHPRDLRDAIRETLRVASHDPESTNGCNLDIMFILLKAAEEAA